MILAFPFLFTRCLGCAIGTTDWVKLIYFVPFVVVFQFGWAAVQISHMALIPDLTSRDTERIELNAIR